MEYSPNAFFWEFVKMFQKIMIIILINIYDSDVKIKGVLSFMVIVVYLILSYTFKPYQDTNLTKLDQLANECSAVSVILGGFIIQQDLDISSQQCTTCILQLCFSKFIKGIYCNCKKCFYTQFYTIKEKVKKFPRIQAFLTKKIIQMKRIVQLWFIFTESTHKWITEKRINSNSLLKSYRRKPKPLEQVKKQVVDNKSESNKLMKGSLEESPLQKAESPLSKVLGTRKNKNNDKEILREKDSKKEESIDLFELNKETNSAQQNRKRGNQFSLLKQFYFEKVSKSINPVVINILPSTQSQIKKLASFSAEDFNQNCYSEINHLEKEMIINKAGKSD